MRYSLCLAGLITVVTGCGDADESEYGTLSSSDLPKICIYLVGDNHTCSNADEVCVPAKFCERDGCFLELTGFAILKKYNFFGNFCQKKGLPDHPRLGGKGDWCYLDSDCLEGTSCYGTSYGIFGDVLHVKQIAGIFVGRPGECLPTDPDLLASCKKDDKCEEGKVCRPDDWGWGAKNPIEYCLAPGYLAECQEDADCGEGLENGKPLYCEYPEDDSWTTVGMCTY